MFRVCGQTEWWKYDPCSLGGLITAELLSEKHENPQHQFLNYSVSLGGNFVEQDLPSKTAREDNIPAMELEKA